MPQAPHPSARDLIEAYVAATPIPDTLAPEEAQRELQRRHLAATAAIQAIRDDAEEASMATHRAYRPEITSAVAVPLSDDSDWEAIAKWCSGTIQSAPDGTDSGEWSSWIELENGQCASSDTWIVKNLDGSFNVGQGVEEPNETTLRQVEAIGWEKGASTALSLAIYGPDGTLALSQPNPGAAFLPTNTTGKGYGERQRGHHIQVLIETSEGLYPTLACNEPVDAPCRGEYGQCTLVEAFEVDPAAAMEGYTGTALLLHDAPIQMVSMDEFDFTWKTQTTITARV